MPHALDLKQNHLLAVLPEPDLGRWTTLLELVDLPLGKVLYESGTVQHHVYFPTTSIVSLLYVLENGASAEIAVVGNEGVVGIALFMGGHHAQPCCGTKCGRGLSHERENHQGRI